MNSEVINNHIKWMKHAERSKDEGEVPVGAVIVKDGELIAEGWNQLIAAMMQQLKPK